MASTAHDIIRGAMRLLGAVDPGEEMTASEAADGLELLNEMLESWSNESLSVFQTLQESKALTSGVGSYTIGPTGAFVTTRPLSILSAFIRESNTDSQLKIVNRDEYDLLDQKTVQSRPEYLYYEPSVPNGVIYLYWVPGGSSYTLFINSQKQLQSFSGLTTAVTLPTGYKRALRYNLAIEIGPEYNRQPSQYVMKTAAESKKSIKRQNSVSRTLSLDHIAFSGRFASKSAFMAGY